MKKKVKIKLTPDQWVGVATPGNLKVCTRKTEGKIIFIAQGKSIVTVALNDKDEIKQLLLSLQAVAKLRGIDISDCLGSAGEVREHLVNNMYFKNYEEDEYEL